MGKMSQSDKLRVLPPEPAEQECGCGRRQILQGIAIASLLPLGCTSSADSPPDGPPLDGVVGTGFEVCGTDLCVDLTHPLNNNLNSTNGFRVITSGTRKVIIVRTSDTTFATLTAVCTHAGCSVGFVAASNTFRCPCHGSTYMIDGSNIAGPAPSPLATFQNTFDMAGSLLTIKV